MKLFYTRIANLKYGTYVVVLVLAVMLYGASAGLMVRKQSRTPQYVYLAYSFLHGKLNLIETPEATYDLILYHGLWYVPGAIMPAILMIPFVAIWGLGVSDVLFGVVIGSINILLLYDLLGKIILQKNTSRQNWLTLLFAAGTVHWWLSSVGSVWFNAQVLAVTFMILFVKSTVQDKHPWLAGIWLGLAAMSRPSTIFAVVFFFAFIVQGKKEWRDFFGGHFYLPLLLQVPLPSCCFTMLYVLGTHWILVIAMFKGLPDLSIPTPDMAVST